MSAKEGASSTGSVRMLASRGMPVRVKIGETAGMPPTARLPSKDAAIAETTATAGTLPLARTSVIKWTISQKIRFQY